jgi:AraC family transcriptional regulator
MGDAPGWLLAHAGAPGVVAARGINTTRSWAMIVDQDRRTPTAGCWHSEDVHYFDLCLTRRSNPSRGRLGDRGGAFENLGRMFFVPAGFRLEVEAGTGRGAAVNLFFPRTPEFPDEALAGDGAEPFLRDCLHISNDRLREIGLRINDELRSPSLASALMVEGLGLVLLGELARLMENQGANFTRKGGLAPWRLRLIEERVRTGPGLPTLAELAGLCGLSRRHLMRAFREETGGAISEFVVGVAITRAKTLLSQTTAPISSVAKDAGFATAAGFAAAFRRKTGLTPRAYRAFAGRRSP